MVQIKTKKGLTLDSIEENWKDCTKCEIGKHVRNHVFLSTIPEDMGQTDIVFIGEGPGVQEDIEDKTFVGASGKLLRKAISEVNPTCKNCQGRGVNNYPYVTCRICNGQGLISIGLINLLVCRPYDTLPTAHANRAPAATEVQNCFPRLIDTIKTLNPSLIVSLGEEPKHYSREIEQILLNLGMVVDFTHLQHPSYICRIGGIGSEPYKIYKHQIRDIFNWYRKNVPRLYTPQAENPEPVPIGGGIERNGKW